MEFRMLSVFEGV